MLTLKAACHYQFHNLAWWNLLFRWLSTKFFCHID